MKHRHRKLIDILNKENDYIRVSDLSVLLNVSERTIHYDLEALEFNDSNLEIKKKRGVGVKISWKHATKNTTETGLINDRQLSILKLLLFDEKTVTIVGLAELYFTSPSSIINDLEIIKNKYLNDTTVHISANSLGTRFVGSENEWQRTLMLFNETIFASDSYATDLELISEGLYDYYSPVVVDQCRQMIEGLEDYNLYSVSNHYEVNIFNVLVVMVHRMMIGKHANFDGEMLVLDEVLAMKHYLIASDILDLLAAVLMFSYNENDIHTLSIYLQANRLEFSASRTFDDPRFSESTRHMIHRMSISLDVDLTKDEILYQSVMVHTFHLVYRMKNKIMILNPLLDEIKTHFRLLYDLTWLVFDGEKERLGVSITEDELGFLMLHFQNALDRVEKSKRVLVVCPKGVVASGFIVNRIQRILPPLDVIELASAEKLSRYNLQDVNLIISTIPLEPIDTEVVIVSPLITDRDLENISKAYHKRIVEKDQPNDVEFVVLQEFINKDFIFTNNSELSQEALIREMGAILMQKDIVMDGYIESMIEREKIGGTELASGAAVPHGTFNLVKRTIIPIWISETPIDWNGTPVHIIVFFVIAKDDLKQSQKILKDVFKLVNHRKRIKNELKLMNADELYDYIKR